MMYSYRLLNVFAETTFGGNPLCVVEQANDLSTEEMQAIALQFNLSETVFLMPSASAHAKIRIFTPSTELPFAGHPSLGAAQVVSSLVQGLPRLTLECGVGIVELHLQQNRWTLSPPVSVNTSADYQAMLRPVESHLADLVAMLGISLEDLADDIVWVNTGNEHVMVPVRSTEALHRARIASHRLNDWPVSRLGRQNAYVFCFEGEDQGQQKVKARYWFAKDGSLAEDPATGSAAANLGAWWIARSQTIPQSFLIEQGAEMRRPSRLYLNAILDTDQVPRIQVGGSVIEMGSGVLHL